MFAVIAAGAATTIVSSAIDVTVAVPMTAMKIGRAAPHTTAIRVTVISAVTLTAPGVTTMSVSKVRVLAWATYIAVPLMMRGHTVLLYMTFRRHLPCHPLRVFFLWELA
jgi:hypothetical protein